jgi:hypothetical protein
LCQKLEVNVAKISKPAMCEESGKCWTAEKLSRFESGRERGAGMKNVCRKTFARTCERN